MKKLLGIIGTYPLKWISALTWKIFMWKFMGHPILNLDIRKILGNLSIFFAQKSMNIQLWAGLTHPWNTTEENNEEDINSYH